MPCYVLACPGRPWVMLVRSQWVILVRSDIPGIPVIPVISVDKGCHGKNYAEPE
jgi:hypothetical protein